MMPRHTAQRRDKLAELVPFNDPASITPGPPGPVPDLGPVVAARLEDWSRVYGIPLSTLRVLRRTGKGPKVFEVGRLLVLLAERLDQLAGRLGRGWRFRSLVPPAGRFGRRANRETTAKTSNSIEERRPQD